ncbi:beta-1,4 N-acetylgalactosaminyltransferase 1-like [Glandiceps talaboti]
MPFAEGWFPGRNLLLSQVQTKYFVWVDDDFVFTNETSLEKMVSKMENKNWRLDVVAGLVDFNQTKILDREYNKIQVRGFSEDGYCLKRRPGSYPLKGTTECKMADEVINFFMAKTLTIRSVGFDVELKRFGHHEFFWDGLGRLRVASCSDVSAFHDRAHYDNHGRYRYLYTQPDVFQEWMLHSVFKNNLKCFNWDEFVPQELLTSRHK